MADVVFIDPGASAVYPQLLLADSNISIVRGDTKVLSRQAQQGGVALSLANVNLRMTVKWRYSDSDANAIFVKTSQANGGIVITNSIQGLFTVTILPADTRTISGGGVDNDSEVQIEVVYDLQSTDQNGVVSTGARGKLVVLPDVSVVIN